MKVYSKLLEEEREFESLEAFQAFLKDLSSRCLYGEILTVAQYNGDEKDFVYRWIVQKNSIEKMVQCLWCGSTESAGYYEYGPEHGWAHCPDCKAV